MNKAYVCSDDGLEILDICQGPTKSGGCRRVALGEPVACAGNSLLATSPDGKRALLLAVERDAKACPMAAVGWADEARALWPSRGVPR
jgi:hypothetical protein